MTGPGEPAGPGGAAPARAVVVGGGLAGVTAALDLAAAGVRVTLLERRPRLGGATTSFRRGELTVDNGQHVFLRCCTDYRALLDRLGVADRVRLQDRLDVTVLAPDGRRARLRRAALPAPAHLAAAILGYRHLPPADRARVVRAALALRRLDPADRALDTRTLGEFLAAHGQRPAAVELLWDVFATASLNLPADRASLQLAARVFRTGLLDDAAAGDIGWSRVPLDELHGRAGQAALTRAGVAVRTGVAVRALAPDGAGWVARTDAGAVPGEALVLAVPAAEAAEVLPTGVLPAPERLTALGASPIVNLHVVYDRPVLPLPLVAAVRSPVQWAFDRTAAAGLTGGGQYLAVSLSAADDWIDRRAEEIRALLLPALARLLPRAGAARVREAFVTRERRATFRQGVGSATLRPGPVTAAPGLLLAGAWTDTGWPDTMEGAVRSGHAAARGAAAHLARADRGKGAAA